MHNKKQMYIFDHLVGRCSAIDNQSDPLNFLDILSSIANRDELRRKTSNCIIGHSCFPHNSDYMRHYNTYREDLYYILDQIVYRSTNIYG